MLLSIPLLAQTPGAFEPVVACARCHASIAAPAGSGMTGSIAPLPLWYGSMMAHAARDPYWKAKVRAEAAATPAAAAVIENKCLSCHAPQQQYPTRAAGAAMRLDDLKGIGNDGVGCTVCHQIKPDKLGTAASFTAGFVIGSEREIYGPHKDPFSMPMEHMANYTPKEAGHILESKLCASCHTVITPTLNEKGEQTGRFVEQAPYLEWLRSSFPAEGATCQRCHMPQLKGRDGKAASSYIAHNPMGFAFPPTKPRTPYGLHTLNGGNVQMLSFLRQLYPEEAATLGPSIARTEKNLREAVGLLVEARREGNETVAEVFVTNRTGHKLPTAYPSRRMYLRFTATDAAGRVVFASGVAPDKHGEQPHYAEITRGEQTMIYETVMEDAAGAATMTLMRAARYRKDNRILPRGYDGLRALPEGVEHAATRPVGVNGDAGFMGGGHRVRYRFAGTAVRIRVEAVYEAVAPAHVGALDAGRSAEEKLFVEGFGKHAAGFVMARAEAWLP